MLIKKPILKSLFLFFCLLSLTQLIISCTSSPPPWSVRPGIERYEEIVEEIKRTRRETDTIAGLMLSKPVTTHFWQFLDSFNEEPEGFGMYSYVLVGANESDIAASNYDLLVQTIRGSTAESGGIPKNKDIDLSQFNLFLIPLLCRYDKEICESIITVSIKNNDFSAVDDVMLPNHRLSKLLLSALSSSSSLSFNGPGPYIITVVKPINFGSSDIINLFYIDLTNVHPTVYPDVVLAYKLSLEEKGLEGIKKLESLRLTLLNWALILNDSIGFAKAAYAETKNIFTDSK